MSDTEFVNSRTTGEVRSEDLLVLQDLRNYTAIKAYDLDVRPAVFGNCAVEVNRDLHVVPVNHSVV